MSKFSTSKPRRGDVDGQPTQVYEFPNGTKNYFLNTIEAGTLAALGGFDSQGAIGYLVNPHVLKDLQGRPVAIVGNMSNDKGDYTLAKVLIENVGKHFTVFAEPDTFPEGQRGAESITGTKYLDDTPFSTANDRLYVVNMPCWIPFYHGMELPDGSYQDQTLFDTLDSLGTGYKIWGEAIAKSFSDMDHLYATTEVSNKIIQGGQEEITKYFYPKDSAVVPISLGRNGPIVHRAQVKVDTCPNIAKKIAKYFRPTDSNTQPNPGGGGSTILQTESDRQKKQEFVHAKAKLILRHVTCECDFDKGVITRVEYPTLSKGFETVSETTRANQPTQMRDMLNTGYQAARKADPTQLYSKKVTLTVISTTHARHLMAGNFQTAVSTSFDPEVGVLSLSCYTPQHNPASVKRIQDYERKTDNERQADFKDIHLAVPKTNIERIGSLDTVDDVVCLIVNVVTEIGLIVDLAAAKAAGLDSFLRQVLHKVVLFLVGTKFESWYQQVGGVNACRHTHLVIFSYLESFCCAVNKFATNYNNVNLVNSNQPASSLDISDLEDSLRSIKHMFNYFENLFATNALDEVVPRIKNYVQPKQPQEPRGVARRAEDLPQAQKETETCPPAPAKKQRRGLQAEAEGTSPDKGLFFIKPGVAMKNLFPDDLKADPCGNFIVKGRGCRLQADGRKCNRPHYGRPRDVPLSDLDKILTSFLKTGNGWINAAAWGKHALDNKYKCLLGDEKGPTRT